MVNSMVSSSLFQIGVADPSYLVTVFTLWNACVTIPLCVSAHGGLLQSQPPPPNHYKAAPYIVP